MRATGRRRTADGRWRTNDDARVIRDARAVRALGALVLAALAVGRAPSAASAQATRAEASGYTVTSSHADVVAFLDSLEARAPGKMLRGVMGTTTEGRDLPYVIASRPLVRTPAEARATGKPIVYVQGNIHGGEVEGKEALQALLRDLVIEDKPNALDSIVLIAVPIYNADGNDNWGPQARQRASQDGPERIGLRPNGAGLDLNRDYIKNEAPETLASLRMFTTWDPDVFVDLHTTNGSYHGYALTYSPSLHPAAMVGELSPAGPWTRDTLLPELRRRVRARGFETFDYGNFRGVEGGRDDPTSLQKGGWETYEPKPRFGTNYYGLRNGIAVLSEAYSHDPFERRVKSTEAFVDELLSYIAEQASVVTARTRMAGQGGAVTERTRAGASLAASRARTPVPIRAEMTKSPFDAPVIVETLVAMGDTLIHETGVRRGFTRSGAFTPVTMPVYDRFDAVMAQELPEAWVLDESMTPIIERLRAHGIVATQLARPWTGSGERFLVDSIVKASRPFQGHQEVRLEGRWTAESMSLDAGTWVIAGGQPLAVLAAVMLEPQSDDGLTTWNAFDDDLAVGGAHPVRRVLSPLP